MAGPVDTATAAPWEGSFLSEFPVGLLTPPSPEFLRGYSEEALELSREIRRMLVPGFGGGLLHTALGVEELGGCVTQTFLDREITEAQSNLLLEDPAQMVGRYSKLTADFRQPQGGSAGFGAHIPLQLANSPVVQPSHRCAEAL